MGSHEKGMQGALLHLLIRKEQENVLNPGSM